MNNFVIGTCNVDSVLVNELSKYHTVVMDNFDNVDTIIIDWLPVNNNETQHAKKLIRQSSLVKKYSGNKNIIIFDRYLSISNNESKWLKNKGVVLFEPALNYRRDFNYLPAWIKPKTSGDISLEAPQKKYDIVYNGSPVDNILDFEKYLLKYCKESTSNRNICYSKQINDTKTNEYNDAGLIQSQVDYTQAKYSLLLGTLKDYRIGYLHPDLPKMLELNCIPLVPYEHRYYNALATINDTIGISMYTRTYDKLYYGYMLDTYIHIKESYPEMLVENVVTKLMKYVKRS